MYPLSQGFFDLKRMAQRFEGAYVKDARGTLHEMSQLIIKNYYVDYDSKVGYLNLFNDTASLINYGMRFTGESEFYIICDGSHRLDYALEILNKSSTVILVEGALLPYYAFPMPFRPTTRLTSKGAEKMFPILERDKVHLLNEFLKKVLHYDWTSGGLHVSRLREQTTIF